MSEPKKLPVSYISQLENRHWVSSWELGLFLACGTDAKGKPDTWPD